MRLPFACFYLWSLPDHENGNRPTEAIPILSSLCFLKKPEHKNENRLIKHAAIFWRLFCCSDQNQKMVTVRARTFPFSGACILWIAPEHEKTNRPTQAPIFYSSCSSKRCKTRKWEPPDSRGYAFLEFRFFEACQNMKKKTSRPKRFPFSGVCVFV